jgi:hypothetical protein
MKRANTYQRSKGRQDEDLPGYPEYSKEEDIFISGKEEGEIDPENLHTKKRSSYNDDLDEDEAANNLDIPGTELDDDLEDVGTEDEENNFYSLSDDHNDDLEDMM